MRHRKKSLNSVKLHKNKQDTSIYNQTVSDLKNAKTAEDIKRIKENIVSVSVPEKRTELTKMADSKLDEINKARVQNDFMTEIMSNSKSAEDASRTADLSNSNTKKIYIQMIDAKFPQVKNKL